MSEIEDGRVSAEAARWAMRFFLGREPRDEEELEFHRAHTTVESLRKGFAGTIEFRRYMQKEYPQRYAAPLFLLTPPADPRIPWRLVPPTLRAPTCQICTQGQMESEEFRSWAAEVGVEPRKHRKLWEFAYITAVLRTAGLLRPGARALGFGVGTEPLPSLFARHGVEVMATDAPPELVQDQGWGSTNQHATDLDNLHKPGLLPIELFREQVSFRPVDMNAIPADLTGFDACWSSCALEHLGSLEHGLRFVEASLNTLRPGGVAVHTTEFNLSSNAETFEKPGLSLFRKRDIEALLTRLLDAGHEVLPLNLHPGEGEVDTHIDLPPYTLPHLKLEVAGYVSTSVGLVVRKRG